VPGGVDGRGAGFGEEVDAVRLIPAGGPDVPVREILLRPQVRLGQRGTAERDTRFPAEASQAKVRITSSAFHGGTVPAARSPPLPGGIP
jgi:hypothetical protein